MKRRNNEEVNRSSITLVEFHLVELELNIQLINIEENTEPIQNQLEDDPPPLTHQSKGTKQRFQ